MENGADIKRPNINGGTCLINSVQSVQLCLYLVRKGADINARDIQDKTALHYAIQEHRLDTTRMLIEQGADPYAKSRYGDDALRTACLKGAHQIFDFLKKELSYTAARLAEAHELMGSTFLDEHNESRVCILHWRMAHHIRAAYTPYIEKIPKVPLRTAYENAVEFTTLEELDNIATDMDAMRTQSLLICERVLGLTHKDMLFRLTFRWVSGRKRSVFFIKISNIPGERLMRIHFSCSVASICGVFCSRFASPTGPFCTSRHALRPRHWCA